MFRSDFFQKSRDLWYRSTGCKLCVLFNTHQNCLWWGRHCTHLVDCLPSIVRRRVVDWKCFQVLHWFVLIFFVGLFGGIYLISFKIDIYSNTYRYSWCFINNLLNTFPFFASFKQNREGNKFTTVTNFTGLLVSRGMIGHCFHHARNIKHQYVFGRLSELSLRSNMRHWACWLVFEEILWGESLLKLRDDYHPKSGGSTHLFVRMNVRMYQVGCFIVPAKLEVGGSWSVLVVSLLYAYLKDCKPTSNPLAEWTVNLFPSRLNMCFTQHISTWTEPVFLSSSILKMKKHIVPTGNVCLLRYQAVILQRSAKVLGYKCAAPVFFGPVTERYSLHAGLWGYVDN